MQTVGFVADSQDLLRGRNPLLDSSWTVCTQTPGPVPATQGTTVDLGVVKKAETCPDAAATATPTATATLTRAAAPTTTLAVAPAVGNPKPAVGNPKPRPAPKPQPDPVTDDNDSGGSGSGVDTVNPGSFCDPPGTGVSPRGKAMVCAPAADGRNRWRAA